MSRFIPFSTDMKEAYSSIKSSKTKYGDYMKCLFHFHTPASYDYRLYNDKDNNGEYYKNLTEDEMYEIAKNEELLTKTYQKLSIEYDTELFKDDKELITYLLIAKKLVEQEIEIALITDHNTIKGINKLKEAIQYYKNTRKNLIIPSIIDGIEISCADKLHIVAIFNYDCHDEIQSWIDENIMSEIDGTYKTSMEVISELTQKGYITYIAHFNTSNAFKEEKFLNRIYKNKLFEHKGLSTIGLNKREDVTIIERNLRKYTTREFQFIIDEDSHAIDALGSNTFWIKGKVGDFNTVKDAIRDGKISLLEHKPSNPIGYIKGMYIVPGDKGFITNKQRDSLCITFSSEMNCFIGGRGTGKSTILKMIDFVIRQNYKDSKDLLFICNHKSIWLLYEYLGKEYMIRFYSPEDEFTEETIEKKFLPRRIYYYTDDVKDIAKENILKNYVKLFEIRKYNNRYEAYELDNKNKETKLKSFFNRGISINELVEMTNQNEIYNYFKKTILKNNVLNVDNEFKKITGLAGLKNIITKVDDILEHRDNEVHSIIDKFNETQKGILKIEYKQSKGKYNALNYQKLLNITEASRGYVEKNDIKYNIKKKNIPIYLQDLTEKIGITKVLKYFINNEYDSINNEIKISKYCEKITKELIDDEIVEVNNENYRIALSYIKFLLLREKNAKEIILKLKHYIINSEKFDLQFNVNNYEQSNSKVLYKSIKYLSLGQKVVALLNFVLAYSEYSKDFTPFIVDQPEDNLDNQYIYKNLVKQLKNIKDKRQVIIATHNSTIVTNSKTEQVIIMNSDNEHGWIEKNGYPTEQKIKKGIVSCLEGGVDSFKHKCYVYDEIINEK